MTYSLAPLRRLCILIAAAFAVPAMAAPHGGAVMSLEQPDGSAVDAAVYGDEFHVRVEGLDGYTLVRDPATGFICYARLSADGDALVSTGVVYRARKGDPAAAAFQGALADLPRGLEISAEALRRGRAAVAAELGLDLPSSALPKEAASPVAPAAPDSVRVVVGLILLVDFPDVPSKFTKSEVEDLANLSGYNRFSNRGSVRDYFAEVSHGKLDYSLIVTDYYRAKNNKSYYDRSGGYAGGQELIREALAGLEAKGHDFSKLTTSGTSKTVVALNVLYAGAWGRVWGQGIWPHRGNISSVSYDGVQFRGYQMTGLTTTELTIGTIVHENGHLLFGWPDLYDYDSDSKGAGNFCVMSNQDYKNPQPPNPFFRAGQGWDTLMDLRATTNGLVKVPSNASRTWKWENPAATGELFVIESVRRLGRWGALPDEGLVVWHIDSKGNNSWQDRTASRHYRVSVVQADGRFDLETNRNGGGANDLFHYGNKDVFGAATVPDSKWWNGGASGLEISGISVVQDAMSFRLAGMPVAADPAPGEAPPYRATIAGRRLLLDIARGGRLQVTLTDPRGRSLPLAERDFAAGRHALDLQGLAPGAYVLRVKGPSGTLALPRALLR